MLRPLLLCMTALLSVPALAEPKGFGAGIILGEPTGLTVKKFLGRGNAVDGAVAWSTGDHEAFHLHGDYLFNRYDIIRGKGISGALPVYFGIGATLWTYDHDHKRHHDETGAGVRFPVGLAWLAPRAPFEAFFELVPQMNLVPDSDFDLDAAIGARFYF